MKKSNILILFIFALCMSLCSCSALTTTSNPYETAASGDNTPAITPTVKDTTSLPAEIEEIEKIVDVPLDKIPQFAHGTYMGIYPCGNDNMQSYYTDADAKQIDAYVSELYLAGYEKREDRSIANNRFVTCLGKNGLVHISYFEHNKSLSVLTDPLTYSVYKNDEPEYEKVTEASIAVMSLDFSHREILDANGLSYVIRLEDGRYIVFDGGYKNSKDANILFNYMVDNNKRSDKKIVIAAWVFTHPHDDHYGAFESFSEKYSSETTIQYFIFNSGDPSMYNKKPGDFFEETLAKSITDLYREAKIIKPHTGQTIKFCNTSFEVMYTQESFAPNILPSVNDASLVLRMNINGVTAIFMGDCERDTSNLISKMYGKELKSDILQINHHGYSGGTIELYRFVDPDYSLWPTSNEAFEKRVTGEKYKWIGNALESNKYIYDKLGANNCFVAGGDIEVIFPVGGN